MSQAQPSNFADMDAAAAVGMAVAHFAALAPERTAIVSPRGRCNFGELNARINRVAHRLERAGLRVDDGVALLCPNRIEFAEVYFATQRAGLRLTPINWHLTPEEIAYIVADCGAKVLFAASDFGDAAAAAREASGALELCVAIGDAGLPGFEAYEDGLANESSDDPAEPVLGDLMLYTSGTTGRPKGVKRPRPKGESAVLGLKMFAGVFGFDTGDESKDCTLATGPLYHSGPIMLCMGVPLNHGIPTVLMDKWTPEAMLELIDAHRITHSYCVPTMFHRLIALPEATKRKYDTASLRFIIHGAAPCPVEDKKAMIDWFGPILTELYAATEGMGTMVSSQEWLEKPGTVGRPSPGTVLIKDDSGADLPPGEVGTVFLKPMAGGEFEYFGAEQKTRDAKRHGGFTVGDMGYLDGDGYLFLTGRSAEIVISGGANLYPAEIDQSLLAHPAVADAAAYGVPDTEWGEIVEAAVVLEAGATASAEELIEAFQQSLGRLKAPRSIVFIDEVPRSEAGKIYRRKLRDAALAARG